MKKRIKKEKKSTYLIYLKKFFLIFSVFSILIFLGLNIYSSQNISPLFLGVSKLDYPAVVEFLKKIKKTPYFSEELKKFEKIYGQKLVDDVFLEDIKREKEIKKNEALLKINPNSRDLLYQLYLLYKQAGDEKKAHQYLKKAKEIDPWIKE